MRSLDTVLHAGQRGRDLVKALTDFARKDLETIVPIDLNELLRKEVDLLRHTTLGKVQVVLDLDEALPGIQGAASDLGSAIMNLSVNALTPCPRAGRWSSARGAPGAAGSRSPSRTRARA